MIKISDNLGKWIKDYPDLTDILAKINPVFRLLKIPGAGYLIMGNLKLKTAARLSHLAPDEFMKFLSKKIGESAGCFTPHRTQVSLFKNNGVESRFIGKDIFLNKKEKKLDARPVIDKGLDPFDAIMDALRNLSENEYLTLLNYFEPLPLYNILKKQGYIFNSEKKGSYYFIKIIKAQQAISVPQKPDDEIFQAMPEKKLDDLFSKLANTKENRTAQFDVSDLPAPEPLFQIMEFINRKPAPLILLVKHRQKPLYLPPFLKNKNYLVSVYEKSDHIKIYIYANSLVEEDFEQ